MSTTSIRHQRVFAAPEADREPASGGAGRGKRGVAVLSGPSGWRRQALETLALLAMIAIGQRRVVGADLSGLPHPYWAPVLLASCQYGVAGGVIAAAAASAVYVLELSPQSAAQDFYAYARSAALQPAMWFATALVVGGLRSLHMHQSAELSEQLAASRRRAADLCDGLEKAVAEIGALERRIAQDASSLSAVARALAKIDMRDRRTAAASLGDLFRVGAGAASFVVYLRDAGGYAPVLAVVDDIPRPTASMPTVPEADMDAMIADSAALAMATGEGGEPVPKRMVVAAPPVAERAERLAALVCTLDGSQDPRAFRRRAEDLARLFAAVLAACPDPSRGGRA